MATDFETACASAIDEICGAGDVAGLGTPCTFTVGTGATSYRGDFDQRAEDESLTGSGDAGGGFREDLTGTILAGLAQFSGAIPASGAVCIVTRSGKTTSERYRIQNVEDDSVSVTLHLGEVNRR